MTKRSRSTKFSARSEVYKGAVVADLRAETKVWLAEAPYSYAQEFLAAFEGLVQPIRDRLNLYQTYNMEDWERLGDRAWTAPRTWLTRGKRDQARAFFARESASENDAAVCGVEFVFRSDEALYADENTPYIRQVLPADELDEHSQELLAQARSLGDRLPFLCGHVGYCIEVSPLAGSVLEEEGHRAAFGLSMRHSGATIAGDFSTKRLRLFRGVEAIGWLTFVGRAPLEVLGGVDGVERRLAGVAGVSLHDVRHGLVIQAGAHPGLGDANKGDNLPAYRAVYAALREVIEPASEALHSLQLGGDDDAGQTMRWYTRLAQ